MDDCGDIRSLQLDDPRVECDVLDPYATGVRSWSTVQCAFGHRPFVKREVEGDPYGLSYTIGLPVRGGNSHALVGFIERELGSDLWLCVSIEPNAKGCTRNLTMVSLELCGEFGF
jgi:hypothetical protein